MFASHTGLSSTTTFCHDHNWLAYSEVEGIARIGLYVADNPVTQGDTIWLAQTIFDTAWAQNSQ